MASILHIAFACLHALGKTLDGSEIDTCSVESGTYTSAAIRGMFSGKAYHIPTTLADDKVRCHFFFFTTRGLIFNHEVAKYRKKKKPSLPGVWNSRTLSPNEVKVWLKFMMK